MRQQHDHRFGEVVDEDRHDTLFAEAALSGKAGRSSWLAGVAFQGDTFRSKAFPRFDYAFRAPAVFAQLEHEARDDLTLAASARLDVHNRYGAQLSPRLSALYRPGRWTLRASLGRGFYAPNPFVEEIEAVGLARLRPLADLKAETATTASLEGGYSFGPVEASLTLFGADIADAVQLRTPTSGGFDPTAQLQLVNAAGSTRNRGVELLLRYRRQALTITGSYVHVNATEPDPDGSGRRIVPRTPRDTAGVVAVWERRDKGRIGIEAYYTGRQTLEGNPYRAESRPYLELGLLGEIVLGKVRLFLNLENILGVRQTRYDPLVLPRRGRDGRWTVDAWAPTEGMVVNTGLRLRFGGP